MEINALYDTAKNFAGILKEKYPSLESDPDACLAIIVADTGDFFSGVSSVTINEGTPEVLPAEKIAAMSLVTSGAKASQMIIITLEDYGFSDPSEDALRILIKIIPHLLFTGVQNLSKGDLLVSGFMEATTAAMMIGIARGVKLVLTEGGIIDTVVNGMATPLSHMPLAISAICMLIVQTILNFFIPSGSGQAAVSMPIMAPLADVLGMNRDIAVLAYQFGDGLSNIIWPTAFAAVVSGLARVPLEKYWKLAFKLFGLLVVAQAVLIAVAVAINFGG